MPNGREDIEAYFPGLRDESFEITSDRCKRYNCFAWVVDETERRWWQPPPWDALTRVPYYWPPGAPETGHIDDYVAVLEERGFERCDDPEFEEGWEKVVLYETSDSERMHAAKQTPNGKWSSKLGRSYDIEHETHLSVAGFWAGEPVVYLRRPVTDSADVVLSDGS